MSRTTLGWSLLISANVLMWGVLSFQGASQAAPQPGRQSFANAVEQRGQMIRELQQIKDLLKEQNRLLRARTERAATNDTKPR